MILQSMGLEVEQFPFKIKTGVYSSASSFHEFSRQFEESIDRGFDMFISNLCHSNSQSLDDCFIPSDQAFGKIELTHICPTLNLQTTTFLIGYYGYLGLKCVVVPFLTSQLEETIAMVNQIAVELYKHSISIILDVSLTEGKELDIWRKYLHFRNSISRQLEVDIMLRLSPNVTAQNIERWLPEKITLFCIPLSSFIPNNKDYPVLTASLEQIVMRLMRLKSCAVVKQEKESDLSLHLKYLSFLFSKMGKSMTARTIQACRLQDCFQSPLQPYRDNLQAQTYSIFEFDQPKYDEYQIAIGLALSKLKGDAVVYYIGCGRGKLLLNLMAACRKEKKRVRVYAIDKNPYTLQTVKRRIIKNKWSKFMTVVEADIKTYQMPEKPDLFLSELLGGFGDNELSPQCLKWAEKNIHTDTLCIPQDYASFVKPVSYSKMHTTLDTSEREIYYTDNFGWHFSPFASQAIWKFQHPLLSSLNRENTVEFKLDAPLLIHGILGSFESKLFQNSTISIVPERSSIDSFSWFPIFFPFLREELLEAGEIMSITMRRINQVTRVYYEWCYTITDSTSQIRYTSSVHNAKGKFIDIKLQ